VSVQPSSLPLERLFAPGIRLGWTFRGRGALLTPYREPRPDPSVLQEQMAERAALAQSRYARACRRVTKPQPSALGNPGPRLSVLAPR
jgi:hypothetical protein